MLRVRLLVWLVVNKTLKFRLTILILLTINYPLTALKLKPEIISQGDQELIVYMTILETWDETLITTPQTSKRVLSNVNRLWWYSNPFQNDS